MSISIDVITDIQTVSMLIKKEQQTYSEHVYTYVYIYSQNAVRKAQ